MKAILIYLQRTFISAFPSDNIITHGLKSEKFGLGITLALSLLMLYLVYEILKKIGALLIDMKNKNYRLESLAALGLLNRKFTGLSADKKKIYEDEIPKFKKLGHILEIQNVNPALKHEDIISKREQLERIYFNIFKQEIAEVLLKEYKPFSLWFWKSKRTDLILIFGSIPQNFHFKQIRTKGSFLLVEGMAAFKEMYWDLTQKSTKLITGAMGSGKSVLIASIVTQLLYKPFRVKVILATAKDPLEDFPQFENHADVKLISHATEQGYNELISEIKNLIEIDKLRMSKKFKEQSVKKWFELKEPELKLIIIDEAFVIASNKNWKEDVKLFSDLISLGRSYGHFAILGTQGQRAEEFKQIGIDPDRFLIRVGSKVSTPQLSQTLYNDPDIGCDDTLSHGKMIFSEGRTPTRIRAVYSDDIKTFPKHPWHNKSESLNDKIDIQVDSITTIPFDDSSSHDATVKTESQKHTDESKLKRFKKQSNE